MGEWALRAFKTDQLWNSVLSSFRTPPVITTSPSEDHTYSAGGSIPPSGLSERSSQNNSDNNSNGTSSDAAYESSEERLVSCGTLINDLIVRVSKLQVFHFSLYRFTF